MKKELKGFVCGVVLATLLGCSAGAIGTWDNISVLRNDIKVIVNGSEVTADNFLYNDTTYLPLRAVSEALNQPVEYDEAVNTAYIGVRENDEIISKYIPSNEQFESVTYWVYLNEGTYYVSIGYIAEMMNAQNFNRSDFYGENANSVQQLVIGDKSWDVVWVNGDICIPYDTFVDEIEPLLK